MQTTSSDKQMLSDATPDGSSRINSKVYRAMLSAGEKKTLKYTVKATQDFLKAKKWNILQWPSQ